MHTKTLAIFLLSTFLCIGCKPSTKKKVQRAKEAITVHIPADTTKINEAYTYCKKNKLNTQVALLVNLTQHSGNYRFFAVNLLNKDTLLRGLVTHGHCQQFEGRMATFSNQIGSNCSSEGRYKVGGKYTGMFGTAYKLHGLDSTNCNAFDRFVVLHSHSCVPDKEQADDICTSEGCPTISPNFLKSLEPFIDEAKKPLLLWVYKD